VYVFVRARACVRLIICGNIEAFSSGWVHAEHEPSPHELQKSRRIWGGRSAAVGLATLEEGTYWYSSYVHNPVTRANASLCIGNLHLGMCCAFSRDAMRDTDPRVKDYFFQNCLPSKPFPKPNHCCGRIVQMFRPMVEPEKVMFQVLLLAPVEHAIEYDGPKYQDASHPYLAASNYSCVIEATDAVAYMHVVGVPSTPQALPHFNSTCTTKMGHNDPVVPIGTWIVTHRLDHDLQLRALGWTPNNHKSNGDSSVSSSGHVAVKFHTPRHFAPSVQVSLQAPVSELKKQFLLALRSNLSLVQGKRDDGRLDSIRRLPDPLYQQGDYLSLLDPSQLRFLCDGRSLPVNLDTPLHLILGASITREVSVWVSGPEAALSYESSNPGQSSNFSYQDSIAVWLKSVHLSNPNHDEQVQTQTKFPAKLPLPSQESDDPEHPSILCSVLKLAVMPSLAPSDMQCNVTGTEDIHKRSYGREGFGFVFPYDAKPTLTLTFFNDFHEPTLASDALCAGVLEIRRSIPALDVHDALPEPIFIEINGNTIEIGPDHEFYASIVHCQHKSILTFTVKLHCSNTSIKSVLHLDTLEGNADNLLLSFEPKPLLVPGENETYFVTAEQPLKLDISTTDQTGRPSERGLGHVGTFAAFHFVVSVFQYASHLVLQRIHILQVVADDYVIKFSFLPATKGKGRQQPLSNFFTNLDKFYLENEMHYFDVNEVCSVYADQREFKFHLSQLLLCGKPGKFILKISIIHRARQKPELCHTMNLVIRPNVNDCKTIVNFPAGTIFDGDVSEEPLRFTNTWEPKKFGKAPFNWNDKSGNCDHFFVNNYASGQITLLLTNVSISMNQDAFEGQVEFKMVSGQTLWPNDEATSPFVIERKQKQRSSSYTVSFRPTASNSRHTIRGREIEMMFVSPPKASHCILLQWKSTTDQWDAPSASSLLERINLRFQTTKDFKMLPQQEVMCHAGEQMELLLAVVSYDEENRQLFLSKPDDYNIIFQLQKGRSAAISHDDVEIVTGGPGLGLVKIKVVIPQGAATGNDYNGSLAVSSRRARSSDNSLIVPICKVCIVPITGYLKFESGESPMQLVPTSKPSFYELKHMKIRLKHHSSVHNSPYAHSPLKLTAQSTLACTNCTVEQHGTAVFKLRNSVCDAEFLKFSIGPLHPNAKVKIQVFIPDVDHKAVVRKCCIDLTVPSAVPGQASSASSAPHAADFADQAKRLDKQRRDLLSNIEKEEVKKQKLENLKHLEASIKTVNFGSEDDALSLSQKVISIPGCVIAGDTAKVLLPVLYLQNTIDYSIEQLPESKKHLLALPTDTELKHAGAMLAWKLSDLLQQDTFSTVIIDVSKHANQKMTAPQIYQAEKDAIDKVATEFGQMKFRFLRVCSIERADENRRHLFDKNPLIPADDNFITDVAKANCFDRCQMKPPQCETVLDHPIGFLDWAINLLLLDPKLAASKFRLKFWLPLLQNVAVFDRAQHAEDYKNYRENPDIGLPPITILTVFDDFFFHHDSATGISSYRSAPKPDDAELYNREWGMRVAPAIDRLSGIKRKISKLDDELHDTRKEYRELREQLVSMDPNGAAGWAVESALEDRDGRGGRAARREQGGAQSSKRTKFGESPGNLE